MVNIKINVIGFVVVYDYCMLFFFRFIMEFSKGAVDTFLKVFGQECFKSFDFSESITISTKFAICIDNLQNIEYNLDHTFQK